MTSRNLFFKLMCEDLKRKFWAVGLAFLSFFFWMPVNAAMQISELQQRYENWIANGSTFENGITAEIRFQTMLAEIVDESVGVLNAMNIATVCVSAIVLALTGFLFLHSRKQMDFYHSIPIRREMLFVVKYVNGIFIIAGTYLINMLLAYVVLAANGIGFEVLIPTGFTAFGVQMAGFIINYGLMTIAVMLTGNFFVSILGGIVLFAYIPSVIALGNGLMYLFFETINTRGIDFERLLLIGSPISYYINAVTQIADAQSKISGEAHNLILRFVGCSSAVGLVMAVIAMLLYKIRPSESAGKAMAFKITKAPIKILMVTPITIAISMLFWNIYYSIAWAAFGFVFGLVVTHCIIEIIYHFEFRKLFANLPHIAVSAVLALAVIGVFRFDMFGYDSYKPKAEEFKSASVLAHNLDDWHQYGLPYKNANGYHWNYMMESDYVANNMEYTDYDVVAVLADSAIAIAEQKKDARFNGYDYVRPEGFWSSVEMVYHLKNGKSVSRNYEVNVEELFEAVNKMYVSAEYKEGIYPVLSYNAENITGIYEYRNGKIQEVKTDDALRSKLLLAYQEELTALSLEERAKETPVLALRFLTIAEKEYLNYITASRKVNYSGEFMMEDMDQVNFFPVYPSFEKTLALLHETGAEKIGILDSEDILRIEIHSDYYTDEDSYYDAPVSYYKEQVEVAVTTSAYPIAVEADHGRRSITLEEDGTKEALRVIDEVMAASVERELVYMNGLESTERGFDVRVFMKDTNHGRALSNQEYISYLFKADEIPQFVKTAFQYDRYERKHIDRGLNFEQEN